jgi:hypothetical protein
MKSRENLRSSLLTLTLAGATLFGSIDKATGQEKFELPGFTLEIDKESADFFKADDARFEIKFGNLYVCRKDLEIKKIETCFIIRRSEDYYPRKSVLRTFRIDGVNKVFFCTKMLNETLVVVMDADTRSSRDPETEEEIRMANYCIDWIK